MNFFINTLIKYRTYLFISLAIQVSAWNPIPPAVQTLSSSVNSQSSPDIAMNTAGDKAAAVWVEQLSTTTYIIKASLFDGTTSTWSAATSLTSGTTNVSYPKISMNSAGDLAIAVWLENGAVNSKQYNGAWSAVTNLCPSNATCVSIAMNPTNNKAIAAWGTTTDAQTIHYDGVSSWSIPTPHAAFSGTFVKEIFVTMSGDGTRGALVFSQMIPNNSLIAFGVICLSTTGPGAWDTIMQLSPNYAISVSSPSISMNSNGLKAVAAWVYLDQNVFHHIVQTKFYDSAWQPTTTQTSNTVDSIVSKVIMSADGSKAILVWNEGSIPGTIKSSVWGGAVWSAATNLSTGPIALDVNISGLSDLSKAFAIWAEGPTNNRVIRVSAYNSGTGWQTPASTPILSSSTQTAYDGKVVCNGTGGALLAIWRHTSLPNVIQWSKGP